MGRLVNGWIGRWLGGSMGCMVDGWVAEWTDG